MIAIAERRFDTAGSEPASVRAGGVALFLGSAGVAVTSLLYGLSPPEAAMPVAPFDLQAAIAGAQRGSATMYWAGLIGVPADVIIAAAGMLLGTLETMKGRGLASLGWFLIAVSTVLFAVVDSLVGFVLPPTATAGGQAFVAAKSLFDVLFLGGTATFGLGALLVTAPPIAGFGTLPRLLAVPALVVGIVAFSGGMAGLLGLSVNPNLLGVGIAGGALLFAFIGIHLATTARL